MKVQVLGAGCAKCKLLEERIRQLVAKHQLGVEVEKVTDLTGNHELRNHDDTRAGS